MGQCADDDVDRGEVGQGNEAEVRCATQVRMHVLDGTAGVPLARHLNDAQSWMP
jgi:hypothetical protein